MEYTNKEAKRNEAMSLSIYKTEWKTVQWGLMYIDPNVIDALAPVSN